MPAKVGDQALLLWGADCQPEDVKTAVDQLMAEVGGTGGVNVENMDRLLLSNHGASSFDTAFAGHVSPCGSIHNSDILAEVAKILKPGGILLVREPTIATENGSDLRTPAKLTAALKLAGFIDVSQAQTTQLEGEKLSQAHSSFNTKDEISLTEMNAKKPSYEVGASTQLKLPWVKSTPDTGGVPASVGAVWGLSASDMMDDDLDIMDSDQLLDEEDLKKPDPQSLRVCGDGTKKRKACKDCSCGLAEELEAENSGGNKPTKTTATSSCGSCYLGDAFRCASCPYLGMPAFKPGEKIQLSARQLNADQ